MFLYFKSIFSFALAFFAVFCLTQAEVWSCCRFANVLLAHGLYEDMALDELWGILGS